MVALSTPQAPNHKTSDRRLVRGKSVHPPRPHCAARGIAGNNQIHRSSNPAENALRNADVVVRNAVDGIAAGDRDDDWR